MYQILPIILLAVFGFIAFTQMKKMKGLAAGAPDAANAERARL
jgi:Flp pilus assembly protein TadG